MQLSQRIAGRAGAHRRRDARPAHATYFPDAQGFTGADLYLDDGRYYYGVTHDELKAVAKARRPREGVPKLEREAAGGRDRASPADQARRKMIDATSAPGRAATMRPGAADGARARQREGSRGQAPAARAQATIDDNHIWIGAMDALLAGAGRKDVRAGVMRLLATIDAVKVTDHGDDARQLTNTDFADGYAETLTVDATTGVIAEVRRRRSPGKTPERGRRLRHQARDAANWADAAA